VLFIARKQFVKHESWMCIDEGDVFRFNICDILRTAVKAWIHTDSTKYKQLKSLILLHINQLLDYSINQYGEQLIEGVIKIMQTVYHYNSYTLLQDYIPQRWLRGKGRRSWVRYSTASYQRRYKYATKFILLSALHTCIRIGLTSEDMLCICVWFWLLHVISTWDEFKLY